MAKYNLNKGHNNDILSSDANDVKNEINSVNFLVNSNTNTYSKEFLTTNYVDNLFKAFDEAENYWNQLIKISDKYHERFDSIPMPDSLVDNSISDNNIQYQGTVNITSGTLNFRSSPNGDVIDSIPKDSKVKVIEQNPDSNWVKVEFNGKEGYVYSDYLNVKEVTTKKINNISNSNINNTSTYGIVNTDSTNLNVRLNPSGDIIKSIPKGSKVEILDDSNSDWIKIKVDGIEGYVYSKYIKI